KVEPPGGDPMREYTPAVYAELTRDQEVSSLDLKQPESRRRLNDILRETDLLITSSRPSALDRLGLGRELLTRHPGLVHVAIVGHRAPGQELAGHDVTYVAPLGLLDPPRMPRTLVADIGGAE